MLTAILHLPKKSSQVIIAKHLQCLYFCSPMRKILLHTFAILLSSLMLVESIGIYLTRDICDPCGKSEITAQVIITDLNTESDAHQSCDLHTQIQSCCAHETRCGHNELSHEHHQEHQFFKNISVFLSASNTPELEASALTILAPLLALLTPDLGNNKSVNSYYDYKPKIPQDRTLALLCTYLI